MRIYIVHNGNDNYCEQSQSHTHEFVLSRRGHHWLELNTSPGDKTETYAIRIVPTVYTEITSGALCLYLVHDVDVVFRKKKYTRGGGTVIPPVTAPPGLS